jgi:CheY-like chemotaxis protein
MRTPGPILIADDNEADVELMTAALRTLRPEHPIVVTRDGVETLDYLRGRGAYAGRDPRTPSVLFLDLNMLRLDGFSVLRELRADPVWRLLPIVILTSAREDRDIAECYLSGSNAYVVKPVDFREFHDTLNQLGRF